MCFPLKKAKKEREWLHVGLQCVVVQADEGRHRCGYVRVPKNHPHYGKDYDDVPVTVHGGLTFSAVEPCEHDDGRGFWYGFDCAHAGDAMVDPVFNENWPERTKKLWNILQDNPFRSVLAENPLLREHYWTLEEVAAETEQLAEQLARQMTLLGSLFGAGQFRSVKWDFMMDLWRLRRDVIEDARQVISDVLARLQE